MVIAFLKKAREEDWLRVAYIPGGLTSLLQVCDLVCNKDLKAAIKHWYRQWKVKALKAKESTKGHVKLAMPRDDFIPALEQIFNEFNVKQRTNPTIKNCFAKVGMDIFNPDMDLFKAWMKNCSMHALYRSLIEAQVGVEVDIDLEIETAFLGDMGAGGDDADLQLGGGVEDGDSF